MVIFTEMPIQERKLESEIMKDPEVLETGLKILDHQVTTDKGPLDILAVDKEGALVVIELKTVESDDMILQALGYLDFIEQHVERMMHQFKTHKIDGHKDVRLFLVAPSFSDRLKVVARRIDAELFEYLYLKVAGREGLHCKKIEIGTYKPPAGPVSIETHIEYIQDQRAKKLCRHVLKKIQSIDKNIRIKPTKFYIGFQLEGRNIATIAPYRNFFYLSWPEKDGWGYAKIKSMKDFTNNFDKIKNAYSKLAKAQS